MVETQFYHNTAVVPLGGFGTIGASFTAVTMDEMMVRTVQDPEPNEYGERFNAGNLAIGLAFAKKLTDRFSFGFKTKFIQESIWQMSAQGLAVDIGTLFITKRDMRIGMSISNFGGKLGMEGVNTLVDIDVDENIYGNNDRIDGSLGTSKWPLPLIFRFGISREFLFSETMKCLLQLMQYTQITILNTLTLVLSKCNGHVFLRIGKSHTFYRDSNITVRMVEVRTRSFIWRRRSVSYSSRSNA